MSEGNGDTRPFELTPSEDSTELLLRVTPGTTGGADLVEQVVKGALALGVMAEIDRAAAAETFRKAEGNGGAEAVIAKGSKPQKGSDAKLLWSKKIAPKREGGRHFSHYIGRIERRIVHVGDPVAKLIPETAGKTGADIFGGTVKAEGGKPLKIRAGPGIRESDRVFFAEKDGMVQLDGDLLKLDEVLLVEGNLDFETGNIDFPGSVVIEGGILDLFEVKAGGAIQIRGLVEAANLTAKGDIEVDGGVAGKTKGRIVTNASLAAKFLVNAYVYAEGDVAVEGEIVASKVAAFGTLASPECSIAGSEVEAVGGIDVAAVGSELGVATAVGAGAGPALTALIKANAEEISKTRELLIEVKKALSNAPRNLTVKQLEKAKKEIARIHSQLVAALKLRKKLALAVKAAKPVVKVSRIIYPGAQVRVGKYTMSVEEEIQGPVKFTPDDKNRAVRVTRIG